MAIALAVALVFQFRTRRYIPAVYWLVVVLISIAGTLMTDNLVDGHGVSLNVTTTGFAIALALTFLGWYLSERSLSIHTIVTSGREAWKPGLRSSSLLLWHLCWRSHLGEAEPRVLEVRGSMFAAVIVLVAVAHFVFKMGEILAFWMAYILTRPLGASLGDYLLQKPKDGGLGLGTGLTTFSFLAVIVALVIYLSVSRADLDVVPRNEAR